MECPRCHENMAFDSTINTMHCSSCGYRLFQDSLEDETPTERHTEPAAQASHRPPVKLDVPQSLDMNDLPGQISDFEQVRMRGRIQDAMFAMGRGNREEIIRTLKSILDISEDYPDAWLQLAALAENADEQRLCLEHVIATAPAHPTAMKALAELDGKTAASAPQEAVNADDPTQIAAKTMSCPQCGGKLTYDEHEKEVICHHCGFLIVDADDLDRSDSHNTVLSGNLKRKQQPVSWQIGRRWFHCNNCGANLTLTKNALTKTCRFCHSTHLMRQTSNYNYEQPDLIVPFGIGGRAAQVKVEDYLNSGIRKLTRLFTDAIDRIELNPIYLPCWVFDADMVVAWSWSNAPVHGKHPILLSDVLQLAVPAPSHDLFEDAEPYDLRRGVDFDERLLADIPARLYDADMTESSLDVREKLGRLAVEQAGTSIRLNRPTGYRNNDDPGRLRMNASTQFLTYRLALVPVWLGRLIEVDADWRHVLVNGQTGRVALGRLNKA